MSCEEVLRREDGLPDVLAAQPLVEEDLEGYYPESVVVLSEAEVVELRKAAQGSDPGWYVDPLTTNTARFWSERGWTARVRLRAKLGPPQGRAERAALGDAALKETDAPKDPESYRDHPPRWRRERNRDMTEALRRIAHKWRIAMEGRRYGTFSLIGTEDWEDYASAAIGAMTLETISDLQENAESLEARIERLERLLIEIRDLLRDSRPPEGDTQKGESRDPLTPRP